MISGSVSRVVIDASAFARYMATPGGDIIRDLERRATDVQAGARAIVRKRTRALERSIVKTPGVDGRGPFVTVGSDLDYALIEHDGSRPHVIRPRNRKVLRFVGAGGSVVFAQQVNHPGTTGTKYLVRALPLAGS